ncbi:MAG: hypothetical protein KKA54_01670, partial [Proteobacteria bacterium]|nr:hypothetical protein [Pseudomonadota bacterium]
MALITHQGISAAIANLQPNPATLKGRLISLIHSYFPTEERLKEIDSIPAEDLIRQLWEVDDPAGIRQKKKNLSSLKSSINKDLKSLSQQGKNPEGLIIGRDNIFTISDEHKDDLLQKLGLSGALDPTDILTLMRGILDTVIQGDGRKEAASSLLKELDKTREMIARAAGLGGAEQDLAPTGIADTATGSMEDGAADAGTATGENGEKGAASDGLAEDELTEPETGVDAEENGGNEAEPTAEQLLDEEEFEVLDEAEILELESEIIDEAGSPDAAFTDEDMAGTGTDQGAEGAGATEAEPTAGELLDEEELEVLDDAEILEQESEIIDEAGSPDAAFTDEDLAGTGTEPDAEGSGSIEAEPAAEQLFDEEEFEVLDEAEILEQESEIIDEAGSPDAGFTDEDLAGTGTEPDAEGSGSIEVEPAAGELFDEEEFEVLDEAEILEQESEIIDEAGSPDAAFTDED